MTLATATWQLALLAGCQSSSFDLEARFPSSTSFLRSDFIQLRVVPLTEDRIGDCPDLAAQAAIDALRDEPVYDSGKIPPCDFLAGVPVGPVEGDLHAYVVSGGAAVGGNIYVTGCAVRDLDQDSSEVIQVFLSTTDQYRERFPVGSPPPSCPTPEARCGGDC